MLALTIRLIASLAVVVGLMLLLARFTGRRMRGSRGSLVQVVHRQPLSRTSGVAVVSIGDRVLVLGTTEQNVSLITELDPEVLDDADLFALPGADEFGGLDDAGIPLEIPLDTSVPVARSAGGSHRGTRRRAPEGGTALSGSILSADTWRQAVAALGRRAS